MFTVEWLKQGVTVERETFALAKLADAVATARWRAVAVAIRHPGEEPESFRLIDDTTGALALTVKMYDRRRPPSLQMGEHLGGSPGLHPIVSLLI